MLRRRCLLLGVALAFTLVAGPVRADWPSARHDPQRTGASTSTSDILHPAVYWKAYVGGSLSTTAFLSADVNSDGSTDLVYVSGGAVFAKSASGQTIWQTPPRSYQALYAVDDFDGDGQPDVLTSGPSQVVLLSGKDGTVEWTESSSDLGTLGGVRVANLNGDGRPDVVVEDCHCCAIKGGGFGYAYSFARTGGVVVGTQLWTFPSPDLLYSCEVPTVLFDGDGDGTLEIAHPTATDVLVVGSGGQLLVDQDHSPVLGSMLYWSDCVPANVDGQPGDELVCFQSYVEAELPTPRQVYVLHYDSTTSPASLSLVWQNTTLAGQTSGDLDYEPNEVVNLDGDGTLEVVVAGMTDSGVWTTYVLDAKTGATLGTIPNARIAGTAPMLSGGNSYVITTDGQSLTGWIYDPTQAPSLSSAWVVQDRHTMTRVDSALLRTQRANLALVTPDLDQDGVPDLVTSTVSPGTVLYGYSAPAGAPQQVGTFSFPPGVDPIATWVLPPTTQKYSQVAMAANDGFLRIFDDQLNPTPGVPIGGYCAGGLGHSPVAASFGGVGGTQSVFANDSRGALLRFDAQTASLASPPKPQWATRNCAQPSVVQAIDGARPGIVCQGIQQPVSYPPLPAVSAIRGDGSLIWNAPFADVMSNDALPGAIDASGAPAVIVQTQTAEGVLTTRWISGSTGLQLLASPAQTLTAGVKPFSVADWDGDGIPDVVSVMNTIQAVSGATGQTITGGSDYLGYGVPLLADLDGDGILEATLQATGAPPRTYEHDLETATWIGGSTEPYPSGSIATCSSGAQLVEGSLANPSHLYFTKVAGPSRGATTDEVLAGGQIFASEAAAQAAGAYLASLSDVTLGTNLTGSGNPTALVGSSDGWLYAVDACAGTLQFVLPMGESVCGTILADTDGNGRDEILVGTSGGYLYDVQNEELGGCGPVLDIDPPHGITDNEVSQLVSESTVFGAWNAVPGAASYEAAVVHNPEGIVSDPPWQDVGNVTTAAVTGLPLIAGQTYYFAVRAVGPQGKSVDALSAGVTVVAPGAGQSADGGASNGAPAQASATGPSSPSAGGCGCNTARDDRPSGLLLFLAAAVASGVRRRSRT